MEQHPSDQRQLQAPKMPRLSSSSDSSQEQIIPPQAVTPSVGATARPSMLGQLLSQQAQSDSVRYSELEAALQDDDMIDQAQEITLAQGGTKMRPPKSMQGAGTELLMGFLNLGVDNKGKEETKVEEEKKIEEEKKEELIISNRLTVPQAVYLIKHHMPIAIRMMYVPHFQEKSTHQEIRNIIEKTTNPKFVYQYSAFHKCELNALIYNKDYVGVGHLEQLMNYVTSQKYSHILDIYREKGEARATQVLSSESRHYLLHANDAFKGIYNSELALRVILYMLFRKGSTPPDKFEYSFMGMLLTTQQKNIRNVVDLIYADEQAVDWIKKNKFK